MNQSELKTTWMGDASRNRKNVNEEKNKPLEKYREENTSRGEKVTSDAGMKISNNRWSLRAGRRGPQPRLF